MMINRFKLLALLFVGAVSACSTSKAPPAPLVDFNPSVTLTRQWVVTAGPLGAAPSVQRTSAGTVILLSQGKEVQAYQANTGEQLWRSPIGLVQAPIGVSADGKTLLALVQGSETVALNASTGAVLWRNSLPAEMRVQPAFVGGVFVVLTADGRVVGLDEITGRRRWAISRTLPALSVRGTGAVSAIGQTLAVVGLPGGKAIGVNVTTGQVAWETGLAQTRGVNEVERIADVLPQWVAVQGLGLCATTYRQRAACVDDNGDITHAQDMNALTALVTSGQQWFAVEEAGNLSSWTLKSRSKNPGQAPKDWSFEGLKNRTNNSFIPLAALGNAVYVHDNAGYMHVLLAQSGKTIARVSTGLAQDVHLQTALVDGKTLLIVSSNQAFSAWLPGQ